MVMKYARGVQGGIYHGRILLPPEYPFKPPSFIMLSPNGRFETGVKICLSISSHHPEHWQPSWSVRTALTALIAFMPSPGNGAIGSLVRASCMLEAGMLYTSGHVRGCLQRGLRRILTVQREMSP